MSVAEGLIGFHIGAIIALSAGMIVLLVFAARARLWAGGRSGSDPVLGGRLGYLPVEVRMLEYRSRREKPPRKAALLIASRRGLSSTWT